MTFSIVARCNRTGMFGVAISSSSPAVAARCSYAQAGVGAVASQNVTDPELGPRTLNYLAQGLSAADAISKVMSGTSHGEYRQLLAVDKNGTSAVHSGAKALGIWASAQATDVACGGNLLASERIPQIMVESFLASQGDLGDRLIAIMRAAVKAGGEAGPVRSSGLKLVREMSWPVVNLRCDWTNDCPIEALAQLWDIYKPQMESYVMRAINPAAAPNFGVPGDP